MLLGVERAQAEERQRSVVSTAPSYGQTHLGLGAVPASAARVSWETLGTSGRFILERLGAGLRGRSTSLQVWRTSGWSDFLVLKARVGTVKLTEPVDGSRTEPTLVRKF